MALPAVLWLAVSTVLLLATVFGYRALAAPPDLTMAEAAVLRDEAEVLRQIRHGVDPNVAQTVRPGIYGDDVYTMTPLEAAIAARHVEIVEVLANNGVTLDDGNLPRLICLARNSAATDIADFLGRRSAAPAPADCHSVRFPW